MRRIGIGWQIIEGQGWGTYGTAIVRHLHRKDGLEPVILERTPFIGSDSLEREVLNRYRHGLAQRVENFERIVKEKGGTTLNIDILHARGNDGQPAFSQFSPMIRGNRNYAMVFSETSNVSKKAVAQYGEFDRVFAGSTWNADVLREAGVASPIVQIQGVDTTLYRPGPKVGLFPDEFVVFSGGKLEFRKGQDIVAAAFKIFIDRHPNARLVCCWGNKWPSNPMVKLMGYSPHVDGGPDVHDGRGDVPEWLSRFGIPLDRVTLLEDVPPIAMPRILREADVAVFPNRGEGGTNLVAMEAMACGVPTILSANTGHVDIIDDGACLPLSHQVPVNIGEASDRVQGWGESSVEEVVAAMERVWSDTMAARRMAKNAVARMESLDWSARIDALINALDGTP